ncbi:alcohol dehydrogenase catalytic domain-containing protein [Spirilliplanes yamanashiensis]|uniref:alcohol dehydrogenase n=1 Tax=Spirilliplanes yamanashiensis TaxID=42233 RepID=A0A8J3YBU7_9ACTN|nr:alcohol dehydrogenase catalytic domain-containing protein [Spirilliplanes yamanashiensis]MDP9818075.1 propanol-preferring alcohol dehydrogenase [Spirilliplanes yamanashiensis]GIJ04885.1 zinc-dependent alcohol dehydrogenase [Spirilliplanes yamanashiensis]
MRAVVLESLRPIEENPVALREVDTPSPGPGQVLVKISSCGVCRSNLHMIEGDWAPAVPSKLPIIPGHEVVGAVTEVGAGVDWLAVGDRVGVQPLYDTCGRCAYCVSGREQLCQAKEITGESVDGGYAEYLLAAAAHTYRLPDGLSDVDAAPLFCPGITAYGSLSKARLSPGASVAVFGVGGVGHLVLQMAGLWGADVIAVTRGRNHQELAEELGATVVDGTAEPGAALARRGGVDAAIVFAPSSAVLGEAIRATKPGGIVVVGAEAEIGPLPFADEKTVVGSVLGTREQMREVLRLAAAGKVRAHCERFALDEATEALTRLKQGRIRARAVLVP